MDREYTYKVLGCVYEVYKVLGPGLLESIYEAAMIKELKLNGFEVKNQVQVPVYYIRTAQVIVQPSVGKYHN